MKKSIVGFLLALMLFTLIPCTCYAKSSLKDGNFMSLSEEDKEKAINDLVKQISKELGIEHEITTSFYEYDWAVIASNTIITYHISVNMSGFENEQELVNAIAHEVRHTYQYEHRNDDTDYGRACLDNFNNYTAYYNDLDGYYQQFIEVDAIEYAESYVEKYFN